MKCPWQKEIKIWLTREEEIHTVKFADCVEDECPYWFDMNGEKICRKVEWPE